MRTSVIAGVLLLGALVALPPTALGAQATTRGSGERQTRWTVALGPSTGLSSGAAFYRLEPSPTSGGLPTRIDELVGASESGVNASIGLARALRGTALEFRAELLYNRATRGPATYLALPDQQETVRMAMLDQSIAFSAGYAWHAFPERRWSPYLVTAVGVYHSRLGTNPDDQSSRITETRSSTSLGVNAGAGLRFSLMGRELFAEARRHQPFGESHGSPYVPVTIGLRF